MSWKIFSSGSDYTPSDPTTRRSIIEVFPPAAEPKTELARYRILAPTAGARVSPICLGAMSVGDQWKGFMGNGLNQKEGEEFLDAFYEMGGNFIDTANNYQDEQSETILGEWMEKRGIRDEIFLATKYTTFSLHRKEGPFKGIGVNFGGNHKKSLLHSLEKSLQKLRTTYIDLLYIHWWDYSTSIPEIMQSLNDVVKSGKVLYLGISDTPAWIVSQANEYARAHGLAQFVVYQGAWNLSMRDMERDIIPMCRANGMAIAPWGVMGQGKFKSTEELEKRANDSTLRGNAKPTEEQLKMCAALEEVAKELGDHVHLAHVAMAWSRQMVADCFPIIGGTSISHLKSNAEALKIHLSATQMEKLTNAIPFEFGFPYNGFGRDPHYLPDGKPNSALLNSAGHIKFVNYP